MRVLYDITVLGIGHHHSHARTGVFRVVENLAHGLKNSTACDLTFCTGNPHSSALLDALDYLEANPELAEISLPHESWKFKQSLRSAQVQLKSKIAASSALQKIPLEVIRKLNRAIDKGTEVFYEPFNPKALTEFDLYHSPFYAVPKQLQKAKHLKKFLTVMDLIPILYPKFFEFKEDDSLKQAVSSLDSESWVLCISESTKNDLCNYSTVVDPSKVVVTPLAASKLFYACNDVHKVEHTRKKYGIPDAPYLLSLSTLEPRKNIDHIIRCFAKLIQQENIQDLHLVLVGTKGWNYDKIFDEISSNAALKKRIITTGFVADEDLAALYSGALTFIYPSFYEGFGLPPLEAMQCGVPVITSNTSSLPEVIGDAGIMLAPTDVDGLCQSILKLYHSSSLRDAMALQSLEQARKFSWDKCTEATITAYKAALSA